MRFSPGRDIAFKCEVDRRRLTITPDIRMPRYFVDVYDGFAFVKDDVGFDIPGEDLVVRARLLSVMVRNARGLRADVERQDLFCIVRDEASKVILRGHLSLDFEMVENI